MPEAEKKEIYISPDKTKIELNCRTISSSLLFFKEKYGTDELKSFVEKTGMRLDYLQDESNWVSFDYFISFLNALVEYTGDEDSPFKAGTYATQKGIWRVLQNIFASFGTIRGGYKLISSYASKFNKVGLLDIIELGRNRARIAIKYFEGYNQHGYNCRNLQGQLASIPKYYGMPLARINELQCSAEGAESCIYELTWINRPRRLFGLIGLVCGALVILILHILIKDTFVHLGIKTLLGVTLPLLGYLLGRSLDFKKIFRENSDVIEREKRDLLEAIERNESLNIELQEKVEERTKELAEARDNLEEKVMIRTKELRNSLKELKDAQAQLIHAEKMASIGQLSAGVAHEFRNKLNVIRLAVAYIRQNAGRLKEDAVMKYLDRVDRSIDLATKISKDLLTFARPKDPRFGEVELTESLDEVLEMVGKKFTIDKIEVRKEYDHAIAQVKGDKEQLMQVFLNIILNSIQAMPRGGQLDINLDRVSLDSKKYIQVLISDTGKGMPDDVRKNIFDPFFTTKGVDKGTGLGLSVSHGIIEAHGGFIEVESEVGKGSTFKVNLPLK